MIIKELELYNFRIYKGLNKIDFSKKTDKNIFIVSGKNGFGKTTFLMSLVWCLYGRQMEDVDDLYYKEINDQGGYSKYIHTALNRLAENEGENGFHVSITFTDVTIPELPCQEIVVKRSYNKLTSGSDSVEILIDGNPNELTNEVGPEIFIRDFLLPKEIAKFFFFDAEKIVTLAEENTIDQRRKLSKAYSEVLGIKKYEDLKTEIEEVQYKLRKDSANFTDQQHLIQLEADLQKNINLIEKNEGEIKKTNEDISFNRQELNSIQEKLIRAGSTITIHELNDLKNREIILQAQSDQLSNEIKDSFDLVPFAFVGKTLLNIYNQLEEESSIKKSQFALEEINKKTESLINELSDMSPKSTDIVIHFKVKEFYADTLRVLLKKHFLTEGSNPSENFQVLHDFSEVERNEFSTLLNNLKSSFKESFKRISGENQQVKNELNNIRKRLREAEANQEDPLISILREQKQTLENDIENLQRRKFRLESENIEIEKVLNIKEREKLELTRKLKVSKENKEKDEQAGKLINYLKDFIIQFKEKKKKSLESEILKGLEMLMHKKDFIKSVEVEIISDVIDIKLFNDRNEEIRKGSLSKGEQQMYATALLRGLVEESDIDFPVFIDSPMQKFDEQHAENIVKYFYPSVSNQVVIFPLINKEMTSKEFDMLMPYVARTYLIDNIHQDKSQFLEIEPENFLTAYNQKYNAN
jgi:DNA sulfur modification protein DndD